MFGAARALHCPHQRVCPAPAGVGNPLKRGRARARRLQLFSVNEEFLVLVGHQLAGNPSLPLCTHRPSLLPIEWFSEARGPRAASDGQPSRRLLGKRYELDHF